LGIKQREVISNVGHWAHLPFRIHTTNGSRCTTL
jgi:hypothetical protein